MKNAQGTAFSQGLLVCFLELFLHTESGNQHSSVRTPSHITEEYTEQGHFGQVVDLQFCCDEACFVSGKKVRLKG